MLYIGHTNDKIEHTNMYIEHTDELQAAGLNKNYVHVVVGFWKRALLWHSSAKSLGYVHALKSK